MITVTINGMSVPAEKASEGWLNQMIAEAHRLGGSACILVSVQTDAARLGLSSPPGCGGGGGGGRAPNALEQRIMDAWNRRGLNQPRVHPGELRAFLQDLARLT